MGALGAFFATGLAIASKKFAVEVDPRIEQIEAVLPGANCGGCGHPGCSSFADAVVAGNAEINGCPVGGSEVAEKIAEIMGVSADAGERKIAQVLCKGGSSVATQRSEYRGIQSCRAATAVGGGSKGCEYGCLGFGDCAAACPFGAITMSDDNLPVIDPELCTGCGKCVGACPKSIITLVGESRKNHIRCSAYLSGKEVRQVCKVGCIGCGICAKNCPVGAIEMKDNLAVMIYEKCINCGICAEKCPMGTIDFYGKKVEEIKINDKCIGCTLCARVCPVSAIKGEVKQKHEIDPETCIKCGLCYTKCKKDAIDVKYKK
ncbi:RnfABCDGE type electron transport complex subunit B [Anoxybacter fermentans]|uniref:Ion-translocating oxidoreductase complex subunit B n=2 Tax=Anoxybacter fermentans TaxID=1323375 RepID=A0A3Q9HTE3_9FIRM|nr:RnfABCDGE type electron transport complex subunit B [Anoxybacter fermentans]